MAGVVAYLVIGSVYMYKVKGARGVEVIPNYTFWKDVPFLIKVLSVVHIGMYKVIPVL